MSIPEGATPIAWKEPFTFVPLEISEEPWYLILFGNREIVVATTEIPA